MKKILISGASVAGPVLAHWLHRYGFEPTLVERTPAGRHGLGGHAVDLFSSAADITRRMGCWDAIEAARTRLDAMTIERFGKRPVEVDLSRMYAGISTRHVEILRGELTRILYAATRDTAEYVFGDSIAAVHDDGAGVDVTFESGAQRRFDLVIGADGLHSNVRRLVFGPEEPMLRPLGGYLAVFSMPDVFGLGNHTLSHFSVGKLVGIYGVHQTGQVRAGFLFRAPEVRYDYRDKDEQKALLVKEFRDYGWKVPSCWSTWCRPRTSTSIRSHRSLWTPGTAAGSAWSATRATAPVRQSAAARALRSWRRTSWRVSWPRLVAICRPGSATTSGPSGRSSSRADGSHRR